MHVHLGDRDLWAQLGEALHVLGEFGDRWIVVRSADVHLHADPIDGDATADHVADPLVDGVCLVVNALRWWRFGGAPWVSREEAVQRIRSQIPTKEKLHFVDTVIDNNGDLDTFKQNIASVIANLR